MRRFSISTKPPHHFFLFTSPHKRNISPFFCTFPSPPRRGMSATAAAAPPQREKIVVVMGPTGCGKTKLSVDLISRFFPSSEIINSDKIQLYRGLDITTNKIPVNERRNIRHHLLGDFDASDAHPVFTAADFRLVASESVAEILSRRRIPFLVGGSNSLIYAFLAGKLNTDSDVFTDPDPIFAKELRYDCCFLHVDVAIPVLNQYLVKRVDDMLDSGMFEELAAYFSSAEADSVRKSGLRQAIGLPEFEAYFRRFGGGNRWWNGDDDVERREAYFCSVEAVKENTCQLARRQIGKIVRLRDLAGWELRRVETTAALRAAVDGAGKRRIAEIWERQVVEPSVKIVKQFLME